MAQLDIGKKLRRWRRVHFVEDADEHCARVRDEGAKIISEPVSAHGHRRYTVEDPEGHQWTFASVLR